MTQNLRWRQNEKTTNNTIIKQNKDNSKQANKGYKYIVIEF